MPAAAGIDDGIKHAGLSGNLVILGFGTIAQAVLPLLLRHLTIAPAQVRIISANADRSGIAASCGVAYEACRLDPDNYRTVLAQHVRHGDFLLNLSLGVSSPALIDFCRATGALYLDTCIEPWPNHYVNPALSPSQRSNYALREQVLALGSSGDGGPTALVTQGANPGLASMFVKQALLNLAADQAAPMVPPRTPREWATLALALGIKTIHIAERDSQLTPTRKQRGEFVNTWSVPGFIAEALQPAELGWGSHERHWPPDAARHDFGCNAAIYLRRPGAATRVRSWTPLEGCYHGYLISHGESISIADHLSLRNGEEVVYRPTVHYAYHPCDDAVLSLHELAGKHWRPPTGKRVMRDEITHGMDELGVLLMGHHGGVYWFGSRLSIAQARTLAPYVTATSLQVAAGVLGGVVWALDNPAAGIVEPDDIDHDQVLDIASPYLGELVGVYGDWTPLKNRSALFDEATDRDDPWQFINFRVS